jgi:hypothetical protein
MTLKWIKEKSNSLSILWQGDFLVLSIWSLGEPCEWLPALTLCRNSSIHLKGEIRLIRFKRERPLKAKGSSLPSNWWMRAFSHSIHSLLSFLSLEPHGHNGQILYPHWVNVFLKHTILKKGFTKLSGLVFSLQVSWFPEVTFFGTGEVHLEWASLLEREAGQTTCIHKSRVHWEDTASR